MTARGFSQRLARRARRAGVHVPDDLAARLWTYFELLLRWNRKMNLTSLDDAHPDASIDRLLIEPLVAVRYLPAPQAAVIDVGSGGGSPAIPLKLAAPGISLVMVEVKARKSAFLREAVRQLNLNGTRVENARFEQLLASPDLHEAMQVLTIRAVRAEPRTLLSLQAFLRLGGQVFLFRGGGQELDGMIPPPLALEATYPLTPDDPGGRLVILTKRAVGSASPFSPS
jgi:16S rRNA (guanine527-N7)-methyltransferase